jgi:hypothetical protein
MQPLPNGSAQLSSPSSGDILKAADIVGHLLIVRPVEFLPDFPTSNGNRDAVRIDVCDLSANDEKGQWGAVSRDALWFGRVLVSGLRRQIGEIVLGRMSQGVAKPGQSPPFNLVDMMPDAEAVSAAQQWLAQHPDFASGHAQSSASASAPPAPVVAPPPTPVPVPAQQQYAPQGQPYPPQQPAQYPGGQYPPAPVPQQPQPIYQPYPAQPYAPGTTAVGGQQYMQPQPQQQPQPGPLTPGVNPNLDPYAALTDEARAALKAIGFQPPQPGEPPF